MALKAPEQVIRQALLDSSVVQALCGTRIYPVLAPSSTDLPFLVYRRASIGTVRTQALAGAVGGKSVNLEFTLYAQTYEAVRELAYEVNKVLDGWSGNFNNVSVGEVRLTEETDDFVVLSGGDLPPVYQVTQAYNVIWIDE
jgi:hypothetical protein